MLTSVERLVSFPGAKVYLLCSERKCIGILKIGKKKLFIRKSSGVLVEMEPLCVLDFYVHESEQRNGFGKVLFDHMLLVENVLPHKLAIDRPSAKFLGFLRKHYALTEYIPQTNNFVVFNKYFDSSDDSTAAVACGRPGLRPVGASQSLSKGSSSRAPALFQTSQLNGCATPKFPCTRVSSGDIQLMNRSQGLRRTSPTRSGSGGYNIITLQDEGAGAASRGSFCLHK